MHAMSYIEPLQTGVLSMSYANITFLKLCIHVCSERIIRIAEQEERSEVERE